MSWQSTNNEFITCFSWILNLQILFMKFYVSFWKGSKVSFSVMRNSYSVIFEPNKKLLPGKGGFFSESVIRFSNLQISNNSKVFLAGNLDFKFRIVFWNNFFGDLKNELHFLKKKPLAHRMTYIQWPWYDQSSSSQRKKKKVINCLQELKRSTNTAYFRQILRYHYWLWKVHTSHHLGS